MIFSLVSEEICEIFGSGRVSTSAIIRLVFATFLFWILFIIRNIYIFFKFLATLYHLIKISQYPLLNSRLRVFFRENTA